MYSHCQSCGKEDESDSLTPDGRCFECDLAEAGIQLVTAENVQEMLDRVDEVMQKHKGADPIVVWDSLLPS